MKDSKTMATTSEQAAGRTPGTKQAALLLWMLPVYGLLLMLGTLTHQPDPVTQFADYSRYITTQRFLVSHIVASIIGGGIGMVGIAAALVFLLRGRKPTLAAIGATMTLIGNVMITSVFGAAAYAQPAIGRAFLAGNEAFAVAINNDVYGAPLLSTVIPGLLLFMIGGALLGTAVARSGATLRMPGTLFAVAMVLFPISGFTVQILQPVSGALVAVAGFLIAQRLPRALA